MKVLSVAWTIFDSRLEAFSSDYTGGGLVIKNICEYIGRIAESYIFIGQKPLNGMKLGNMNVVNTLQENAPEKADIEEYLAYMRGQFIKALAEIEPDIVNFHGIGDLISLCIEVCEEYKIPYVVTCHLFVESVPTFGGYERTIQWQRDIYSRKDLRLIAVGSKMKEKIEKEYPNLHDIEVILNGTDFMENEQSESDIILPFEDVFKSNAKTLLCVGTLLERKNQLQVVAAFKKLPEYIQKNLVVLFCGKDRLAGELQKQIEINELQNKLIYCGTLSSTEMIRVYNRAQGLIMPSKAEGLSIAALEAISCGLPLIMFSDSECADDLNDEKVVCFATNRSDEALADAICKWFDQSWDEKYIKEFSYNFTMEKMAKNYLRYYHKVLKNMCNKENEGKQEC